MNYGWNESFIWYKFTPLIVSLSSESLRPQHFTKNIFNNCVEKAFYSKSTYYTRAIEAMQITEMLENLLKWNK